MAISVLEEKIEKTIVENISKIVGVLTSHPHNLQKKCSIVTKVQTLGGKEYLVDEHNIVYTKNILNPTIVGKIAKGKLCI